MCDQAIRGHEPPDRESSFFQQQERTNLARRPQVALLAAQSRQAEVQLQQLVEHLPQVAVP